MGRQIVEDICGLIGFDMLDKRFGANFQNGGPFHEPEIAEDVEQRSVKQLLSESLGQEVNKPLLEVVSQNCS